MVRCTIKKELSCLFEQKNAGRNRKKQIEKAVCANHTMTTALVMIKIVLVDSFIDCAIELRAKICVHLYYSFCLLYAAKRTSYQEILTQFHFDSFISFCFVPFRFNEN